MPIFAPRMACICEGAAVSRSMPSNRALPDILAPLVSPVTVWVETLLPEPDSPTMPRVCPASMW